MLCDAAFTAGSGACSDACPETSELTANRSFHHAFGFHARKPFRWPAESISVSDLRYTRYIKEEIKTNPNFRRACRAAWFEPKILATVDDILLVYYFAENNIGVGISTARLAQNLNIPNVRSIPFVEPELSWKVLLIKRKNATLSKEAKILAKALLADRDARFSEIGVKGIPLSAF